MLPLRRGATHRPRHAQGGRGHERPLTCSTDPSTTQVAISFRGKRFSAAASATQVGLVVIVSAAACAAKARVIVVFIAAAFATQVAVIVSAAACATKAGDIVAFSAAAAITSFRRERFIPFASTVDRARGTHSTVNVVRGCLEGRYPGVLLRSSTSIV
jgi:hypothetical protein